MNNKIAIYLRLSLSDGDLKKGSKDESNSIENQRLLLHSYIEKQDDLSGEIVEYVDDGYTGTNFNRPAFQKMIIDLKQGEIKTIVVKDLSRLGRDYIGVGDYIEQIFPLMGVRFIAVNNAFDSMKLNNGTPGIEVAVSNLVNNLYSRDIGKKVRAALEVNWKSGKATSVNVPFGYVWNGKGNQRWAIDPEAAACVRKVFDLALSGRNTTQIAYAMNELGLPTPGLYSKRKNTVVGGNAIIAPESEILWNPGIVWRVLRRYEYTGALVMGRRQKLDVNTTAFRTLPEDKWIITENTHEAIVTKDEYYQAQKAIRNVAPIQYKTEDDFALKGKICCGNCRRQLRHEKQYGEMVFCCGHKRSVGKFSHCYSGYYREQAVNSRVARAIKTVFTALEVVNQGMQEKKSITLQCVDVDDLKKQAEMIRAEQIKLYESYADGILTRNEYLEKKKGLGEKLADLQEKIRIEEEEQETADELDEEIRSLTKQASQKTYIGGLTKECVDAFVSMVYLYDDQTMKVEFNCEDTFFEDAAITYKLLYTSKKIAYTEKQLYAYSVRGGSMITTPWSKKKSDSYVEITNEAISYFDERKEYKLAQAAIYWQIQFGIEAFERMLMNPKATQDDYNEVMTCVRAGYKRLKLSSLGFGLKKYLKKKLEFFLFTTNPRLLCKLKKKELR